MKTSPITANASQLGIPINRRFPMTLSGGVSLERLGRVIGYPLIQVESEGYQWALSILQEQDRVISKETNMQHCDMVAMLLPPSPSPLWSVPPEQVLVSP